MVDDAKMQIFTKEKHSKGRQVMVGFQWSVWGDRGAQDDRMTR